MDIIAICLVCQLTAQLPTLGADAPLAPVIRTLEEPVQNIFSSQGDFWIKSQPDYVEGLLLETLYPQLAETSPTPSSKPFWVRWLHAFTGKSNDLKKSPAPVVIESGTTATDVVIESAATDVVIESIEEEPLLTEESELAALEASADLTTLDGSEDIDSSAVESDAVASELSISLPQTARTPYSSNTELTRDLGRRVSPDVELLQLASTDLLLQEPVLDAKAFRPATGATFNDDGTVNLRVLVGNPNERLTVIGDFNNWGNVSNLDDYTLYPSAGDPIVHEATLPPGDYHKAQYRLRDQDGRERLDMGSPLFSTPAFNTRFYGQRADNNLNSVLWKSASIPDAELAPRVDLRGQQLVIAESDIASLALKWTCNVSDSRFFGQSGAENISQLYSFVAECGLPEELSALGYNAVQFMPLDAHVDFWDPERFPFPDWRYSYINISFYAKHADFGSPDELKQMINAFHRAQVAVLIDVIYSHYSDSGNEPPREFYPLGFSQYHSEDGWELYGGPWTRWGTRRFSYTPAVRRNLVDAALINVLDYGFDGLRLDNVNGIDRQPEGRTFLRELTEAIALYEPKAVVIGEGYFGDAYLNKSRSAGGAGLITTYSDRFYLWFTENIIKYRDEIDTRRLDYMLSNDWPLTLLYYPGNHDEFANPGNQFQTRGRYLSEAIQGGVHTRKIQSWSALAMFSSSYYLDMVQQWTLQSGSLNNNSLVDWDRFKEPYIAELAQFQGDMKRFYTSQPAFAAYNTHRHMLRWMDHENKVAVFEKIDFTTGQRVYAVVNLGERAIDHYKIPVFPDGASFRLALDSDQTAYGGSGQNSEWLTSDNRELEFFLGSYGVVGLVQQDKFELPPNDADDVNVDRPTGNWYY
ncbi:MAG: 1,4-alpha-glucan-branching protein [Leptolyngbya sp. SIO3F4]|nr:1,4-alpha-glucan-branching protein [Leptolyngbya sp. SIO3F4]